jgi:hypothetical protein
MQLLSLSERMTWFDVHDWVLTPGEAHGDGDAGPVVTTTEGFLHLPGRASLGWKRQQKVRFAYRKLRRARRWARVIASFPFVRCIAIGNALGYGNSSRGGDIDLVIMIAPGRLWIARGAIVSLLKFFRQRPHERSRDALCPSFLLTTDVLNVECLQLDRQDGSRISSCPDPYLLFWTTQLTVLYDIRETYHLWWAANVAWVRAWLPRAHARGIHPAFVVRPWFTWIARVVEAVLSGRLGDRIERVSQRAQVAHLPKSVRVQANCFSSVVISSSMAKTHVNDRRAQFRSIWHERCSANS